MPRWLKVALVVLQAVAVLPGTTAACLTATYEAPAHVGFGIRALATSLISASVTTTASVDASTYDASTVSRVDDHAIDVFDARPALLGNARARSAPPPVGARVSITTPRLRSVATEAASEAAGAVTRPAGVADDFVSEVANSGKGTVWRAPGSTGNAGTVRIMEPTAQYPDGHVRFYNDSGQPIGLNGKPGPNSVTHIPLNPDGTYPLPKDWRG